MHDPILYRTQQDDKHVNELLSAFGTSPAVKEVIDVAKLSEDWLQINRSEEVDLLKIQTFVKGLMYSYFIWDNERKQGV